MPRRTAHVDFRNKSFDNVRFVNVTSFPVLGEHLLAKYYVYQPFSISVDEPTLVRVIENNDFINHSLINISHISLKFDRTKDDHAATKASADSLSQKERSRRDLFFVTNV